MANWVLRKAALHRLRWRLTGSYALVALATLLVVEWWGLVGAALFLSQDLNALSLPGFLKIVGDVAFQIVLPTALIMLVPSMLLGGLFGLITARWLDDRLAVIRKATQAWQQGNFDTRVRDTTGDEISELCDRLNDMAGQLQALVETQQGLAALEERNRLARDLHDTVKQETLAASMQIAAARASLEKNPQAASQALLEASDLVHQVQQELVGLIWELRPLALKGRGLPVALREFARSWSRQTGIPVEPDLSAAQVVSETAEEALYRIAQEALANVARHGQAQHLKLGYRDAQNSVILTIQDDGVGFDPALPMEESLGLRTMRQRAKDCGGSLTIDSSPGQGTTISAQLPL
jgi:NarL family two-component system sensor histidine kinase LiaS